MDISLRPVTVVSGVLAGVLALVAVAAALATRVPALERPVRVAVVVAEALVVVFVVADVGLVLRADAADRPDSLITHLGYALARSGSCRPSSGARRHPTRRSTRRHRSRCRCGSWRWRCWRSRCVSCGWRRPGEGGSTGRQVLVAVYAVFAVAAGARSIVQIATDFDAAPLAYTLSAVAAAVYVVATLALRRTSERARRVAIAACSVEAVGVVTVGTLSLVREDWFPDQTVWSDFGVGYGFVPLVLPFVGLWWLLRVR